MTDHNFGENPQKGIGRFVPLKLIYKAQNAVDRLTAIRGQKPGFVIVGTGRCGTNYVADYLTAAGHPCGHERFYRPTGPAYRAGSNVNMAVGDSSWLAVPFLPESGITVLHQTRSPIPVIQSFLKLGFFHSEHYARHKRFVDFAKEFFEFSDDPLHSAMRWWVEWNKKCTLITDKQFRLEDFHESTGQISEWLGLDKALPQLDIPSDTNSKRTVVKPNEDEMLSSLRSFPEYSQMVDLAASFGYDL